MTDRKNGRDIQQRVSPSDGSDQSANVVTFTTLTDDLGGRARGGGGRPSVEAVQLKAARQAGAQDERHWLARELHDSVSPTLHSIGLLTSAALAGLTEDQDKVRRALNLVLDLSQKQLDEMRQLMMYVHAESLVEALSETAAFTREFGGMQVEVELCPEPQLDAVARVALYKIAREAMHNASKHAPGCRVLIRLERLDGHLVLDVSDDGPGFDPAAVPFGHYGLVSMRERAAMLGGTIYINSAHGAGTLVRVVVPVAS